MIFYIGLIGVFALVGSRIHFTGIFPQYLSKKNSNAVKGIFILLIFASHFWPYIGFARNWFDAVYRWFAGALGQGVVTYMLFCSGYGVMLSADKKGSDYMKTFPQRRILSTLLIYDFAQILFLFFRLFRGEHFSAKEFVYSMFAWETFGVDNWYIFVILGLYIISWLVLRKRKADGPAAAMITVIAIALVGLQLCTKGWYTTLLCYPLGVWYYVYQEKIDFVMKRNTYYFPAVIILLIFYITAHKYWYKASIYVITMLLFVLLLIAITMKLQVNNPFLVYCGEHLQGLFLLHRIPMIALSDISLMRTHVYLWFACSIIATFFMEFLFNKLITYIRNGSKISQS